MVPGLLSRNIKPGNRDSIINGIERRGITRLAGPLESRRQGPCPRPRIPDLLVSDTIGRGTHLVLQSPGRNGLDAKLRRLGENGFERGQNDVDELPEHAHRGSRERRHISKTGRLREQTRYIDMQ